MNNHSCCICSVAGEPFIFTPWGLLSGLFWVPGGTAGIVAVRTAGLAVSQGTWSTLKIMVRISNPLAQTKSSRPLPHTSHFVGGIYLGSLHF